MTDAAVLLAHDVYEPRAVRTVAEILADVCSRPGRDGRRLATAGSAQSGDSTVTTMLLM